MSADVIVAGAGVAGLRCALALADAGLRVTVLEAAPMAGGRASSWTDEATGLQVDIGPHVITSEHRNFLAMLKRLGTDDQVQWQDRRLITLLDAKGVLRMPVSGWTPPLHGLPLAPRALTRLSIADAWSHRRIAWRAARLDEQRLREFDGDDAVAMLRAMGVRPRAIDWFWRSAILALLNVSLEQCSGAAALRVFRLMLGRSGWYFGFPKVALASLYAPGACRAIVRSGGQVLFGARARRLRLDGDGRFAGVETADGHLLAAARCVLALPPHELATIAAETDALEGLATTASYFRPAPYQSTYVWFDRRVTLERFWARTWSVQNLNTDFYDLANIRPALGSRGSVIACNAIGPQSRAEWSDERIVEHTMREIEQFAPQARQARVLHTRVHRIAMAVPQPRPGTELLRPGNATALPGAWIAGDWTDTALPCSMESAARSGALAAEAVLADMGRPGSIAQEAPDTYGLPGVLRRRAGAT